MKSSVGVAKAVLLAACLFNGDYGEIHRIAGASPSILARRASFGYIHTSAAPVRGVFEARA
jgi:hypothetical protein